MRNHFKKRSTSYSVVYVALLGNVLVAISKFIAAAMSGSSAMLSEGVHSVVDTANEGLLLYGIHRGSVRPDDEHPLGYGREVYFWSFVVALLIFMIGAGVSIYEGISHIANPHPIKDAYLSYIVLGVAAVFEGSSWVYALRKFKGSKPYRDLPQMVIRSKDPPTFIVLLEDSAALIGLTIAAVGIYFSIALNQPWIDGAASILIGIMLGLVAPEEIMVALTVEFDDQLRAPQIAKAIEQLERKIRAVHPSVTAVFLKPSSRITRWTWA